MDRHRASRSGVIYLASPYSDDDPDVRQQRFVEVCRAAANLMSAGYVVFSPIAHGHSIVEAGDLAGTHHRFWMEQCLPMVDRCDEVMVLKLDGWEDSRGVREEVNYANQRGVPVHYLEA